MARETAAFSLPAFLRPAILRPPPFRFLQIPIDPYIALSSHPVLQLQSVTKRFGSFTAVDQLSLGVLQGGVFGLLGPNGAGKTTTIRMIMGIFDADHGEILLDGRPLTTESRSRIGYLPEERGLYKKMPVADHLEYLGRLRGLSPRDARQKSAQFLERVGLGDWSRRRVEDLSKGMAQKVQFCAALLHEPSLVILDEPFSGLDPLNRQLLMDWLNELQANGVTIVLSSHQMETVENLCDSIALINRGRVLIDGNLRAIKERFGESRVRLRMEGEVDPIPGAPGVAHALRRDDGDWDVELQPHADTQALLAHFMTVGPVARFERHQPTLQELFVTLVGEDVPDPDIAEAAAV